jgi:2-iminoacetate synthase ThiH
VTAIVDRAISDAGLAPVLDARRSGRLSDADVALLRAADLLALGALADRVRAEEAGPDVVIYTGGEGEAAGQGSASAILPAAAGELTGLELLREVAIARVTGARGARIGVDWTACGLELAQVALGFGANELHGRVANKRGLPFAEGELLGVGKKSRLEPAVAAKEKEIAGFVRRVGRTPVFAGRAAPAPSAAPTDGAEETP